MATASRERCYLVGGVMLLTEGSEEGVGIAQRCGRGGLKLESVSPREASDAGDPPKRCDPTASECVGVCACTNSFCVVVSNDDDFYIDFLL